MSTKYPGGIISKTAPTPSGPYSTDTAPGVWTLEQQAYWQKLGQWPTQGNVNPNLFIENLYNTWLYTGTGSAFSVTNGIDLSGEGGLVWIKQRNVSGNHLLMTTDGGPTNRLRSNGQPVYVTSSAGSDFASFNSDGFSIGVNQQSDINTASQTYAAWSFRKQPKFFDVVTWTGNGANRTIAHNLGSVPGCIMVASTTALGTDWAVYHSSLANTEYLTLNSSAAKGTDATYWNSTTATSSVFSLGTNAAVNYNTGSFIAYVFADDAGGFGLTGTDNVISCGSFSTTAGGSYTATVDLGYEPQWILMKSTGATGNWFLFDNMRGMPVNYPTAGSATGRQALCPNLSNAEFENIGPQPTATGFTVRANEDSYIYIAIRRGPMKVPTSGTSVFAIDTRNATTPSFVSNFPVDMATYRAKSGSDWYLQSRMTIGSLYTNLTAAENGIGAVGDVTSYQYQTGWYSSGVSIPDLFSYMFRRAPSFFDEVCYTGTGSNITLSHNLGAVPELMIFKTRTGAARAWGVYSSTFGVNKKLILNTTAAVANDSFFVDTTPTATVFYPGNADESNEGGNTYVAYLFASCPGVSKVGSYTGNGTTQTINCGFTGGARFVLIKRTDSTGDWYVWDSARGIVAGNDPYLLLNSTAAEVTGTDYVDTASTGFEISSTAPSAINASGGTFIFLAIA